jgi:DNA-binding transcriptional LysR family regulator
LATLSMNIHHLELFYYVAKHQGISEAVRNIPYGIQQPAVSGQIIQLEEDLGVTLFHRRPFELSAPGRDLYEFIRPFFDQLEPVADKIRGGTVHHIRIGASEVVLREHLPQLVQMVRQRFPQLRFTLKEGYQSQVEGWLERQEIDFAVTTVNAKLPTGLQGKVLMQLPLMLVVHQDSPYRTAEDLWRNDRIAEPLIVLSANQAINKQFQQTIQKRGVDWFPSIEVSSFNLIETYVANKFGIGLFVDVPRTILSPQVRKIELPDFEPVPLAALWRGKTTPLIEAFIEATHFRAKQLESDSGRAPGK